MYKPLVISKDFCWEQNAAGRVDRDFWRNTHGHSISPVIYCSNWLATELPEIVRCNGLDVKIVNEIKCSRAIQSIVNRCPITDLRNLPDVTYLTWGVFAKKSIDEYLKSNQCDYIDSLGMPHGSHLLALKLKRQYGLPWVARFYDPWIDNQQLKYTFKFSRRIVERMEREVAENADVIIHNNTHIAKVWSVRYGADVSKKIKVLPMVFDPLRLTGYKTHTRVENRLVISHIGNLYGVRNAHFLIQSIKLFLLRHPELRNAIKVNIIGWVPNTDRSEISELGLNDVFNLTGRISEEQCTQYFNESDLFISIDGIGELDLNYPSKLLKYFYYRRPILGLTLDNSVAAEELDRSKNNRVNVQDIEAITSFIEKAYFNYDDLLGFDSQYYLRFAPDAIINSYKSIIYDTIMQ